MSSATPLFASLATHLLTKAIVTATTPPCASCELSDATLRNLSSGDPDPASTQFIAKTYARLAVADISGMNSFVEELNAVRRRLTVPEWQEYIGRNFGDHSIRRLIHEDPFTRRAYEKPRGYPGDAPLLDLIYRDVPYGGPLSPLGARLHEWAASQPACRGVQERREILAQLIDQVAIECPAPRLLSVACGHLREAQRSEAVACGAIEEFIALDQDAESVALVEREQHRFRVTPVKASIRRLLAAPTVFGTFDLAYAAGLYDYLADSVAVALTSSMFRALNPGGLMLVANFAPQLRDIGYMEAIMDWKLIYRDENAVQQFSRGIPAHEIAEQSVFRDSTGNVIYLTLRKSD